MTRDTLLVLAILAATIGLFASERLRLDLVAVLALLALSITGILTPAEALAGFASPLVIMIAALFVVAAGMDRTGLAAPFSTPVIMLVFGPGDYRFRDLLRVRLPLRLLFVVLTALVVPRLFPS